MARARRARQRRRTDWVYRPNARLLGGGGSPLDGADTSGTYEAQVRSLTTGITSAHVLWLVDAADRDTSVYVTSNTRVSGLQKSAKPEGKRTRVRFVEGHIYFEPQTWAVGNIMAMGVRICALEQDYLTGNASVDPDMTMWLGTGSTLGASAASFYANDKQLCMYEQRMYKAFSANDQSIMVMRIRARLNWALQAHHGLALWMEGETTGVNVRYQTWLRTLVEVP